MQNLVATVMAFGQRVRARESLVDLKALDLSEELCSQCGECCHVKAWLPDFSCKFLQENCQFLTAEGLCSVYEDRHVKSPGCASIKDALLTCILPRNCAYVQKNWEQIKTWYLLPNEDLLNK